MIFELIICIPIIFGTNAENIKAFLLLLILALLLFTWRHRLWNWTDFDFRLIPIVPKSLTCRLRVRSLSKDHSRICWSFVRGFHSGCTMPLHYFLLCHVCVITVGIVTQVIQSMPFSVRLRCILCIIHKQSRHRHAQLAGWWKSWHLLFRRITWVCAFRVGIGVCMCVFCLMSWVSRGRGTHFLPPHLTPPHPSCS